MRPRIAVAACGSGNAHDVFMMIWTMQAGRGVASPVGRGKAIQGGGSREQLPHNILQQHNQDELHKCREGLHKRRQVFPHFPLPSQMKNLNAIFPRASCRSFPKMSCHSCLELCCFWKFYHASSLPMPCGGNGRSLWVVQEWSETAATRCQLPA